MSAVTLTNEAYCRAILSLAHKAGFLLKHLPPDEYSETHCFIFRLPGRRIFRSGDRHRDQQVALHVACDAIRGDLAAMGFHLPDCPT
jgi:hypothetical protein